MRHNLCHLQLLLLFLLLQVNPQRRLQGFRTLTLKVLKILSVFLMIKCVVNLFFSSSGGVESDGPPKKLFVAGVTDPANRSSYTVR